MTFGSFRMDEMMKGQRGWRELTELGDKGNKISGMLEGIIWPPKGGDSDKIGEDWDTEEVKHLFCFFHHETLLFWCVKIPVITFFGVGL
jgi:hypothetical protein